VEQKVKLLTEKLATENQRPQGGEQQAGEIGKTRSELEAELAENKQIQARLRQQLEETQKQLEALKDNEIAQQSKLEAQTKELQAAQEPLEQKLKEPEGSVGRLRPNAAKRLNDWLLMLSNVVASWRPN